MLNAINPYIAGSPVTGPEMFFGREDVFTFIRQALIGKHRDNIIVLYGQRRTGKTSTLYQLLSRLGPHYLCVFVDLQALHLEGIDGFLWELANHIQRVLLREHQIELPDLERQEFMADARNFFQYKLLDQVWSAIGEQHLLLMLDEAIRLEEQVRAGKLEPQIFEYMSHLMQHYERLNFLFSLGSGLEEMEKEYALLFRTAVYKKISFLDQSTTNALIANPVKDYYKVEDTAQERIFQITSGHPYCVQLLCHNLFNRWQQHPVEIITVQDVEQVLDEAVERGLAVFKHIWEESTSAEKAVMAAVSKITGDANVPVSADAINQAWKYYKVRIPRGEIAQALKNLIARDVIKGEDTYVFCVDLQRLWIQKYRRFDWVAEEIAEAMRVWAVTRTRNLPSSNIFHLSSWLKRRVLFFPVWQEIVSVIVVVVIILTSLFLFGRNGSDTCSSNNSAVTPAEKLVQQYYNDINCKNYQDAYNIWHDPTQHNPTDLAGGYADTVRDDLTSISEKPQPDDTVRVCVTFVATNLSGKKQTHNGYYGAEEVSGLWILLRDDHTCMDCPNKC